MAEKRGMMMRNAVVPDWSEDDVPEAEKTTKTRKASTRIFSVGPSALDSSAFGYYC